MPFWSFCFLLHMWDADLMAKTSAAIFMMEAMCQGWWWGRERQKELGILKTRHSYHTWTPTSWLT
jgi:hypothetical protein